MAGPDRGLGELRAGEQTQEHGCQGTWPPNLLPSVTWSRALYDRLAEVEQELSFKKDDILYVDDTLPQGTFGSWMAWQLDESAQKIQRGQIPSKYV